MYVYWIIYMFFWLISMYIWTYAATNQSKWNWTGIRSIWWKLDHPLWSSTMSSTHFFIAYRFFTSTGGSWYVVCSSSKFGPKAKSLKTFVPVRVLYILCEILQAWNFLSKPIYVFNYSLQILKVKMIKIDCGRPIKLKHQCLVMHVNVW